MPKPHRWRPSRRTLKWPGLILSLFLAAIWVRSRWWTSSLYLIGPHLYWVLRADTGALQWTIMRQQPGAAFEIKLFPHIEQHQWPIWDLIKGSADASLVAGVARIRLPLWSLFTPLAAATTWLFWIDRTRGRKGDCPTCGYSRLGLAPNVVCPECGTAPRQAAQ